MVDMITAELTTGTGARGAIYLIRGGLTHLLQIFQLTPDDRVMTWTDNFLLKPGETIKVMISNLAAADTMQWAVNGH